MISSLFLFFSFSHVRIWERERVGRDGYFTVNDTAISNLKLGFAVCMHACFSQGLLPLFTVECWYFSVGTGFVREYVK